MADDVLADGFDWEQKQQVSYHVVIPIEDESNANRKKNVGKRKEVKRATKAEIV